MTPGGHTIGRGVVRRNTPIPQPSDTPTHHLHEQPPPQDEDTPTPDEDPHPPDYPPPLDPDCLAGKHAACMGRAWDFEADDEVECACGCHEITNVVESL